MKLSDAPTEPIMGATSGPIRVYVGAHGPADPGAVDDFPRPQHTDPALTPRILAPREADLPVPMPAVAVLEDEPRFEPLPEEPSTLAGHTPPPPDPRQARDGLPVELRMVLALEGIERHLGGLAQAADKTAANTELGAKHKAEIVSEMKRILGEQLGAVLQRGGFVTEAGKETCIRFLGRWVDMGTAKTIVSLASAIVSLGSLLGTAYLLGEP